MTVNCLKKHCKSIMCIVAGIDLKVKTFSSQRPRYGVNILIGSCSERLNGFRHKQIFYRFYFC